MRQKLVALWRKRWGKLVYGLVGLFVIGVIGMGVVSRYPQVGAQGAMLLRPIIGNEAVSYLERIYLRTKDGAKQAQYELGLATAEAPWVVEATVAPTATSTPTVTVTEKPAGSPTHTSTPDLTNTPTNTATPTATPTITPTPSPTPWQPPAANPLGDLQGEGVWVPYLTAPDGSVVAYRTFIQPDPARPYAVAGVVAFDLEQTRLNYVLGSHEPGAAANDIRGTGRIPNSDMNADKLLATFNGGFLSTHGFWGAMQDGLEVVPPRNGFMTVATYSDGTVRIGEWGRDITLDNETMTAFRQNGRPVVQDGAIHERVYNDSIVDWGASLGGDIVTWRSGIGISADGRVLYYVAGPSLSMPALGELMVAAGVEQGMLLDINQYWAHFAVIKGEAGELVAEPLFEEGMEQRVNRYLFESDRDFFYVTLSGES